MTSACCSFNGAGVLRPRKSHLGTTFLFVFHLLQWGRGFKTPEITS